jgi:hypothetical protein
VTDEHVRGAGVEDVGELGGGEVGAVHPAGRGCVPEDPRKRKTSVKVLEVARKVSLTRTNSPVPVQAACTVAVPPSPHRRTPRASRCWMATNLDELKGDEAIGLGD